MEEEEQVPVPSYFLCPISFEIMKDPVILPTGITYDRENIEKWIFTNHNNTCPVTKQSLPAINNDDDDSQSDSEFLTPNHTLRRLIQSWCMLNASHDIERFPTHKPPTSPSHVKNLIHDATKHPANQATCLDRLKSIATQSTSNKRCLVSSGAIEFLGWVVFEGGPGSHEALGILSLLRIPNEKLRWLWNMGEGNGAFVHALARLMTRASYELRAHAIVLMKLLTKSAANDGQADRVSYEFGEVVKFLRDSDRASSPRESKAALEVLALTCPWGRNRVRTVEAGAVPILVELLLRANGQRVSELTLTVLEHLCGCSEGRGEFLGHAAGLAVVAGKILRVSHYGTDKGIRILSWIARYATTKNIMVLREMVEVGAVAKLCMVLQVESEAKTKEKCMEVLKLHGGVWSNFPCAPPHLLTLLPL